MIIVVILPRNLMLKKKLILKKPEGQNVIVRAAANLVRQSGGKALGTRLSYRQ